MQQIFPRALRRRAALLLLLAVVFAPSATNASAATTLHPRNAMEASLLDRINDVRKAHGLRPLSMSSALTKAATKHANSMGNNGYFRHELYTPNKSSTWTGFSTWIRWYWPGPATAPGRPARTSRGAPGHLGRPDTPAVDGQPPHRANLSRPAGAESASPPCTSSTRRATSATGRK